MKRQGSTPGQSADAATQAAYWDARLRNPDCSQEERARFEEWRLASAENNHAFEALQDALEGLRAASGRPVLRALRDDAVRYSRRRLWFPVAAVAAAAVAALAVMNFNVPERIAETPSQALSDSTGNEMAQERAYATVVGQQSSIRLEDGSVITLNTQSRVSVLYTPQQRSITLVSGEAMFEVAHDTSRPFVVRAGDRSVRALGTEFNVRLDGDQVRVVLVEGRVAVERHEEGLLAALLPSARQELRAGQQLISAGAGGGHVTTGQVDEAVLWREGRVAFRDVPLTEAVREMNRYSPDAIVLSDASMARLRVNGVFRTGEMRTFVSAVREYFPVETREQPNGDVLLVWRE